MIQEWIYRLIQYGLKTGLLDPQDEVYATNQLLDCLQVDSYDRELLEKTVSLEGLNSCLKQEKTTGEALQLILGELLAYAFEAGLYDEDTVTNRDLFDTRLMNCLMPRPSQVIARFRSLYEESPQAATDDYYKLAQDSDYIRRYRISRDKKWTCESAYGTIDITINLSKPEKDPKEIAAAKNAKQSGYPKCLLCVENEGYAGRSNHPARENHRIIPITISGESWGLQYSPYVYYNEHCIVLNGRHKPMVIDQAAFVKLFSFIEQFPHYFIGSNADLPIVGGSILSHEHFQGGNYTFAMARAKIEKEVTIAGYEDVRVGIVHWPLSVLRLQGTDYHRLAELGAHVLDSWRDYTDEDAFIFAQTEDGRHNTITPIARKKGALYELDLTLRNNITTKERPLGVYHPRDTYHHIKKENIGLIEVMGLAILPKRLDEEMQLMKQCLLSGEKPEHTEALVKHADWLRELRETYRSFDEATVEDVLKAEIGKVFVKVLEDAGVYKCNPEGREAFMRFVNSL